MAVETFYFPGSVYPQSYSVPLPGFDYNPSIFELLDLTGSTVISSSSTQRVLALTNGLKVKLIGTGFVFDAAGATAGTLQSIQIVQNDGTTLVHSLTGINRALVDASDAADAFDTFQLGKWLMSGNDTVNGSAGDDDLYGHAGNDILNGGDGDDFFRGGEGKDTYSGGAGFDTLSFDDAYYEPSALHGVTINATAQTATDPWGNAETYTSMEEFRGSQFADTIVGSANDEQFIGYGGRDTIDGGAGIDEIRYDKDVNRGGAAGVTVNLTTGVAIDGFGKQDTLSNIERIRGTDVGDTLIGSAGANRLRGLGGNDSLNGMAGADDMRGGAGNDYYYVDNTGDIVDELSDSGSGVDTVNSTITFSLASTTQIKGAVENLTLIGTSVINGTGNGLANILNGNNAANTLIGGAGADRLIGGLGLDTLTGGTENDAFVFTAVAQSGVGATLSDRITDFTTGDKIDVAAIDANTATAGDQAFVFSAGSTFAAGQIRQTVVGSDLLLDFNVNADSAAEMSLLVKGRTTALAAGDFVL